MGIEWNPSYSVGIDLIDRQHQELFRQISRLIDAMRESRGKDEVATTLRFLAAYAEQHFALEESLMAEHAYATAPAAEHKGEHESFRATFAALDGQLAEQGPSPALAIEVNNKVCNWLVRHVLGTDKPFAAHLRSKGVK